MESELRCRDGEGRPSVGSCAVAKRDVGQTSRRCVGVEIDWQGIGVLRQKHLAAPIRRDIDELDSQPLKLTCNRTWKAIANSLHDSIELPLDHGL